MSDPQPWQIAMTRPADRDLEALPTRERRRIEAGLARLQHTYGLPGARLDLRQVEGEVEGTYGLRVGVYRVIFRPDRRDRLLVITHIEHRREVYRRR